MANLQRIQERIDLLPSLIKEVEELHPIFIDGPALLESSFDAEKVQALKDKLSLWKAVTSEIISQECGEKDPYLFKFSSRWRQPVYSSGFREGLIKRLKRAQSDLIILLSVAREREGSVQASLPQEDIWTLVHPVIVDLARKRIEDGYYADAVEAACKAINSTVRDIVKAKTGEELDGAKLMQRAFSVDNPVIRLSPGRTVSDQDTQKGYMQIFAGVMTGIRNPKAHDNETISHEDALRKLIMLSILMYKIDKATVI
jgi:uncharacterized protein (TIGR02391 family)